VRSSYVAHRSWCARLHIAIARHRRYHGSVQRTPRGTETSSSFVGDEWRDQVAEGWNFSRQSSTNDRVIGWCQADCGELYSWRRRRASDPSDEVAKYEVTWERRRCVMNIRTTWRSGGGRSRYLLLSASLTIFCNSPSTTMISLTPGRLVDIKTEWMIGWLIREKRLT